MPTKKSYGPLSGKSGGRAKRSGSAPVQTQKPRSVLGPGSREQRPGKRKR